MKKHVILGVNDNPKYLYYLPLVVWAWRKLGWEPITFFCGNKGVAERFVPEFNTYNIRECLIYDPHKSSTISQVVRLYGACVTDGMIMTSDVDMLPLSDYWKPDEKMINTYGRDLTDYHYPICYIAMDAKRWISVMNITSPLYGVHLRRDLRVQDNQWGLDQDIITENLLHVKKEINHIDRGTDKRTGYPIGRVDRSNWRLDHKELIDAHLPHDIFINDKSFHNVLNLLHHVWPKENWNWYIQYHKEFKKLL